MALSARANFRSKVSLDDSAFKSGARSVGLTADKMTRMVRAKFATIGAAAAKLGKAMLNVGKAVAKIGLAIGAVSFAVLATGIKKAFDLGGALSDLSTRTGIAVKELTILQQAFRDNGKAGEDVGPVINKMQKAITDLGAGLSTQVRAFDALGISFGEIKDLAPETQFRMLQERLSALENPTQRAGIAMDILGRSGGELLTLFSDSGALQKAAVTIGRQAELLEKNAAVFDRAADILASVGVKVRGFFVGVADKVQSTLLPLLERWDKLDFTGAGQAFGEKLKAVMETAITKAGEIYDTVRNAFEAGNLGELVALKIQSGLLKAADAFGERMTKIISNIASGLANPHFVNLIGEAMSASIGSVVNATGVVGAVDKSPVMQLVRRAFGEERGPETTTEFNSGRSADNVGKAFQQLFSGGEATGVAAKKIDAEIARLERENLRKRLDREVALQKKIDANRAAQVGKRPIDVFNESIARGGPPPLAGKKSKFGFGSGNTPGQVVLENHRRNASRPGQVNRFGFNGGADGFGGLSRHKLMQAQLARGIGPGANSALSRPGGAVVGAGGLQGAVGGLGAVRKVGQAKEEAALRKDDTIKGTNDELRKQTALLEEEVSVLREAMSVS